jgi:hypothetical protein
VAEGKTIKRAAIPIMVNNSLLSEVYCQNRLAPNKRTDQQLAKQIAKQRGSRTYHIYENGSMNAGFTVRKYAYLY